VIAGVILDFMGYIVKKSATIYNSLEGFFTYLLEYNNNSVTKNFDFFKNSYIFVVDQKKFIDRNERKRYM